MKILAMLGLLATTLTAPLHANGGGYFRGGIAQSGDLAGFVPEATGKVRMVDEKLTVSLGKERAAVEIHYLLRNETDEKVKVRFGFPVEELFDNDMIGEDGGAIEAGVKGAAGKLKYCQDYTVTAGGKAVAVKWQEERKVTGSEKFGEEFKGIAGWLVSELTFAAGEEIPVTIRFRSGYPLLEWSVSDDSNLSPSVFKYRLSTAACWAGPIGTGRIVLKPDGIPAEDLKVIKPVNRFKKDGDQWVWEFKDLEPTLADDFEVEAVPEEKSYMRPEESADPEKATYVTYIERGGKWTMAHSNYGVTASSTLPPGGNFTYVADHVKEFWAEEAWSEGAKGPGTGEWLELKPVVPKPLVAITIRPGYAKDENLFKANARPKTVRVELNGEHHFQVSVPDSAEPFEFPVTGYDRPVTSVKLTFEDVWKGSRHEDLCVSGLLLHVRLDKKPKIQPAR